VVNGKGCAVNAKGCAVNAKGCAVNERGCAYNSSLYTIGIYKKRQKGRRKVEEKY
jgi:hypothetical protein